MSIPALLKKDNPSILRFLDSNNNTVTSIWTSNCADTYRLAKQIESIAVNRVSIPNFFTFTEEEWIRKVVTLGSIDMYWMLPVENEHPAEFEADCFCNIPVHLTEETFDAISLLGHINRSEFDPTWLSRQKIGSYEWIRALEAVSWINCTALTSVILKLEMKFSFFDDPQNPDMIYYISEV